MTIDQAIFEALPPEAQQEILALRTDNEQKSWALKEMREENRNLKQGTTVLDDNTKQELEALRAFKQEQELAQKKIEEQKALERGEYQKLTSEKDAKIAELSTVSEDLWKQVQTYAGVFESMLNQQMEVIPEDEREGVKVILDNTPIEQKFTVIQKFAGLYSGSKTKPVNPKAPWKKTDVTDDSDYKRAVEQGDLASAIRLAPRKNAKPE